MATVIDYNKNKEYWLKRRKNNEAARRSREKRRMNDLLLERRVMQLTDENKQLKAQLLSIKIKYGEVGDIKYALTGASDLNSSYSALSETTFPNVNFSKDCFEASECLKLSTRKDGNATPVTSVRPNNQRFTARVITNANGDTSATVLVNSADSQQMHDSLSSLSFDENMTRIMSKSSVSNHHDDVPTEQARRDSVDHRRSYVPATIPELTSEKERNTSFDKLLSFGNTTYTKDDHDKDASQSETRNPIVKTNDLNMDPVIPLWSGAPTIFPPAMMDFLRDYYSNYESQLPNYISAAQPSFPIKVMLQQIQAQLSKLQNEPLSGTTDPAVKSSEDLAVENPVGTRNLFEQLNAQSELITKSFSSRHKSTDSGFDGSDDVEIIRNTTPLSPPPSPEMDKISRMSSQDAKGSFNVESIHRKPVHKQDEEEEQSSPKTSRSHSVSIVPNLDKADGTRKRKSEFQLPHKLRLKKCSIRSDPATPLAQEPNVNIFGHLDNPIEISKFNLPASTSTKRNLANGLLRKAKLESQNERIKEDKELDLQRYRRFSVACVNGISEPSQLRNLGVALPLVQQQDIFRGDFSFNLKMPEPGITFSGNQTAAKRLL